MILPKAQLKRIEKGKINSVIESISKSGFTGYARMAFKKDELSVAEILFEFGKMVAAEIVKLKSRKIIFGNEAISELSTLDYITAEPYELSPEEIKKFFKINKRA